MTEFESVVPALGLALTERGYTALTPVQDAVLAPELRDADILVSAQTGSGKTLAFGMALAPTILDGAERLGHTKTPLALAIAPTRELAMQVKAELSWLFAKTGAANASCVGGMDMRTEVRTLDRGVHIVVGTPGRLRDHIERGSLDTSGLQVVVLDEADEMLDMGFRDDLEYILSSSPTERRTLMFSATVPRSIASLAKRYQRDAVRISTSEEKQQHLDIEYRALTVAPTDRENAIINVLRYFDAENALVFCATQATVNHMTSRFNNRGFPVVAMSGELSQNDRTQALQAMRDGRARVCIATDVAARGIDLPNLDLVIHADIPKNSEGLLHRSGRTGRAGRKGTSVLIVPYNARRRTERLLRFSNIKAEWARPPSVEEILQRDRERVLADPKLIDPLTDDEQAFVEDLLAQHSAEQIAAAFLRQHLADQTAPEELLDASTPRERKATRRDDFRDGVWFSLSVGHKHSAEPRWLLPMLCRAGNITKNDIGVIKVHQSETHVELAPACVERFLEAVGPTGKVEKFVNVTQLEGVPTAPLETGERKSEPRKPHEKKSYEKKRHKKKSYEKKRHDKKPSGAHDGVEAPSTRQRDDASGDKKPYKKPHPKAYDGADKQRDGRTKHSSSPRDEWPYKRKKPDAPAQKNPSAHEKPEPKRGFSKAAKRDLSQTGTEPPGNEKPYRKRKPDPQAALDPKRNFSEQKRRPSANEKSGGKRSWNKNKKKSGRNKPYLGKGHKAGLKRRDSKSTGGSPLTFKKPK